MKPGSVSSSERMPPPTVAAASWTVTSQPARAIVIAAASPFGPEPITTALFTPRAESEAPGPVPDRLRSTGSNRSPCFSIRARASRIPKSRGRTFSPSSSQRSGVETGAPGFGRTE